MAAGFAWGRTAPQFRVKGRFSFEFLDPDRGDDPALAAHFYAADFSRILAAEPLWLATGGWEIRPGVSNATDSAHSTPFTAHHPGSGCLMEGHVALSAAPSDWVKIELFLGGLRVFVAYLDRPWEEFALWPSGATKTREAPGHIGKRQNWLTLDAGAWPTFERLAIEGWFSIEHSDP